MRDIYVGSFTGAAAAVDVVCGFVPSAVIFFEGGGSPSTAMAVVDGVSVDQVAAATAAAAEVTSFKSNTEGAGFTVANGASFNEDGVTTNFIAFRSDR